MLLHYRTARNNISRKMVSKTNKYFSFDSDRIRVFLILRVLKSTSKQPISLPRIYNRVTASTMSFSNSVSCSFQLRGKRPKDLSKENTKLNLFKQTSASLSWRRNVDITANTDTYGRYVCPFIYCYVIYVSSVFWIYKKKCLNCRIPRNSFASSLITIAPIVLYLVL